MTPLTLRHCHFARAFLELCVRDNRIGRKEFLDLIADVNRVEKEILDCRMNRRWDRARWMENKKRVRIARAQAEIGNA